MEQKKIEQNITEQKKDAKKNQTAKEKKQIVPGEIKGKIEIPDTRERRDGPGGN